MRSLLKSSAFLPTLLTFSAAVYPAFGGIIATTGVTVLSSPPPSVQFNAMQSNTDVFAFQEDSNFTLNAPLLVDVTAPGAYNQLSDIPLPSFIAAGTTVNSYYLTADPDLNIVTLAYVLFSGRSVTFSPNETVIGIQFLEPSLLLGAVALGAPGTAYPPPPVGYGLELTNAVILPGNDTFALSSDRRTVSLDLITGGGVDTGGVDQIRIITSVASVAPVPEPGTVLMMLSGAACVFGLSRRRMARY